MFCAKCGNQLQDAANFCNSCGTSTNPNNIQTQTPKPSGVTMFPMKKPEKELPERGFIISKQMKNSSFSLYVDDVAKQFIIIQYKIATLCNYTDLLDYELVEDGNSITKGKKAATVIGGLAFGPLGALVGMSGKRKKQDTCSSMLVRILLNDLNVSQIILPFVSLEVKKSSIIYSAGLSSARQLTAILAYIDNQNQ